MGIKYSYKFTKWVIREEGEKVAFKNIEAERARNGLSKEEIAKKIGVTVKTYYNWINGINPIPSTALLIMADIFEVDVDYLLERTNTKGVS